MDTGNRTTLTRSMVTMLVVALAIGVVLRKLNGQALMTQPGDLAQITMMDRSVGWALTRDDQIFRTGDGGAKWTDVSIFQVPLPGEAVPVAGACFLDAQTAFVATNAGTDNQPLIVVYRTNDGGATWNRTSIAANLDWEKNDVGGLMVSFADASNGYLMVTGTPGAGQMAKALYRTTDGGTTFVFSGDITGMTDAAGTMSGVAGYPTGMTFVSPETGFVSCYYSAYTFVLMFKTVDSGRTWKLWSLPVPAAFTGLSPANDYYADAYPPVFFGKERKDGVIMLDFVQNGKHMMQSYHTTDGGSNWTMAPASDNHGMRSYSFIDAATGWGIDDAGKLFATSDGGAVWRPVAATAK